MSRVLGRKLESFRIILEEVSRGPRRWNDINKRCLELSSWRLQSGLCWLLAGGYLERRSKGLYALTARGEALLKLLRAGA